MHSTRAAHAGHSQRCPEHRHSARLHHRAFNTVWSLNCLALPIPVFDRNRGNIMAAGTALIRASSDVERASNDSRNQLADAYNNYATNEVMLKYYRTDMIVDQVLPYRALRERYRENPDKIDFVGDIVQQQQTLAQLITGYVQTLGNRWQAVVTLAGLLQVDDMWQMGSLAHPEAITTPKPAQDGISLPPPEKAESLAGTVARLPVRRRPWRSTATAAPCRSSR